MNPDRRSESSSDERSSLVSPQRQQFEDDFEEAQPLTGEMELDEPSTSSKSSWYLFILTLSLGGLQVVWSVEMSNLSPYLLSLGMTKSLLAFVWTIGPLSGVLVQPYIGIRSDNCRISWGKRKPFMIGGGLATVLSLMLLAWIQELVGGFLGFFGAAPKSAVTRGTVIIFATLSMCVLDFAINTIQAGIRAFIVDNAPAHQQESANAWASRITGVGNVLGYIFGYLDLPRYFPFFGDTQFRVLCVIASLALGATLLISCLYIKERDPRLEAPSRDGNPGVIDFFKQVFKSIKRLPPEIRKVCEVQFFSWIGWFPFLFYITTYIGQLYVNPYLEPDLSDDEIDEFWEKGTRVGTFALLLYAVVSVIANFVLPFMVEPSDIAKHASTTTEPNMIPISPTASHRSLRSSFGALPYPVSSSMLDSRPALSIRRTGSVGSRAQTFLADLVSKIRISYLTLRRVWIMSNIFFAICMFSTFFISTPTAAIIMTACVGVSWSVTQWVPFALISAEVAMQDETRRNKQSLSTKGSIVRHAPREEIWHQPQNDESENDLASPHLVAQPGPHQHQHHHQTQPQSSPTHEYEHNNVRDHHHENPNEPEPEPDSQPTDQAGVILGLHNVAISAPQILSTLLSSFIFMFLQRDRHVPGDTSVEWVMRVGGVAALVAAWWGWRRMDG